MQNATFVSSADRYATKGAGGFEIALGRFFPFPAQLCAGSPRLTLILIFLTLALSPGIGRAGELAAALQASLSLVATNAPAVEAAVEEPNSYSLSFSQRPVNFALGAVTLRTETENLSHASSVSFVVPQKWLLVSRGRLRSFFSGQAGNGNVGLMNFEAGYGQAYDPDSVVLRSRNGTGLEEPRYVFFKRIVKF